MKKTKIYFFLVLFGLLLNACKYDFIVPAELPQIDTTVPVSFATQITPIFTSGCVSCHKTGGQAPDLSAANAYNGIKTMNLFNTKTPESSIIYALPGSSSHSWKGYSASDAQLVLTWIKQGALNN